MIRSEWLALFLGVPATILAAAAVGASIMRWQAKNTVFWVLRSEPQRWAALAKEVGVFDDLFRGAALAQRLELDSEKLHVMIVERLEPLSTLPVQFAKLDTTVDHFADQITRLAKAVEGLSEVPTRVAVLEERSRNDTPPKPRRGRT